MRPNVNTQTALTLPGPIPLQKGVGPGDEAIHREALPCLPNTEACKRRSAARLQNSYGNYDILESNLAVHKWDDK